MSLLNLTDRLNHIDNKATAKLKRVAKADSDKNKFSDMVKTEIIQERRKPFSKSDAVRNDPKLWATCEEMESIFMGKMLKEMRKTVHKGELFHGGRPEEIFEDMLYDEYALNVSKNTNVGIASMLYDQLSRK